MNVLPIEKRVSGQRVKWYTDSELRGRIEYTGIIVPLPDDHPLKAEFERTHEMVYVEPDYDKFPWLNRGPYAWWDWMMDGLTGRSGLYAEDEV